MGIVFGGTATISGDNKSVLCNTRIPEPTLKKKSQSIAYDLIREGAATDKQRMAYMNMHDNNADLLMKVVTMSDKRRGFFWILQHEIFGSFPEATAVEQCWDAFLDHAIYDEYLHMRMQNMDYIVISFGLWLLSSRTSNKKWEEQAQICRTLPYVR